MKRRERSSGTLRRRLAGYGLIAPGAIWLVVFFVIPMYFMAEMSLRSGIPNTPEGFTFSWEFSNYSDALAGRGEQIVRTFYYASAATIIALLIAYPLAYATPSLHECVFSDRDLEATGVHTLDVAKRLLDYGFFAPTIYFPLVVPGALMIEPTETESLQTLDEFVAALEAIAAEAHRDPELVKGAPHATFVGRLDETRAARRPVLRWTPSGE